MERSHRCQLSDNGNNNFANSVARRDGVTGEPENMHQINQALLSIWVAAALGGQAYAAEIIVDGFDFTDEPSLSVTFGSADQFIPSDAGGTAGPTVTYAVEALGDYRSLLLDADAPPSSTGTARAAVGGAADPGLALSRTDGVTSTTTTMLWDGNGGGLSAGEKDNQQGQGNSSFDGDITSDNTNDGLLVGLPGAMIGAMDVTLNLRSGSGSGALSSLSMGVAGLGGFGDLFFPFVDFVGTAILTELFSIEMIITDTTVAAVTPDVTASTPAVHFDALIGFVKAAPDPNRPSTPVPLPATLTLLMIGFAAGRVAGHTLCLLRS